MHIDARQLSQLTNLIIMRKQFEITDSEWDEIIRINKEGSDPVMYLSGGTPMGRSKQEKINDFWSRLGKEKGFDWETIKPINDRNFTAVVLEKETA